MAGKEQGVRMADGLHSSIDRISLVEARAAVVEGRVSAAALAEEHYERIAKVDPEIHSFLALTRERAMTQAEKVDTAVKAGDPVGPLAGVPVGIKDVLTVKGVATTQGRRFWSGIGRRMTRRWCGVWRQPVRYCWGS